VVAQLLAAGANVDATCLFGQTALLTVVIRQCENLAFTSRTYSIITQLLAAGANVNATDARGITVLMHAVWADNLLVVNDLLKEGADVRAVNEYKWTALIYAVTQRLPAMLRPLLDAGADIHVLDNKGRSALNMGGYGIDDAPLWIPLIAAAADTKFEHKEELGEAFGGEAGLPTVKAAVIEAAVKRRLPALGFWAKRKEIEADEARVTRAAPAA
jgi:ankyrin repeat protein